MDKKHDGATGLHKADSEASSEDETPNDRYEVYCSLCKVGFSSTVNYRQHMKSSKHLKAEKKEFMKEKYSQKYAEAIAKMKGESQQGDVRASGSSVEKQTDNIADDDVYTCDICKKACTGIVNYRSHLRGKYHTKQVRKQKLIKTMKQEGELGEGSGVKGKVTDEEIGSTLPQLKPFVTCEVCKKSFSGPEGYEQHLQSEAHRKGRQKAELIAKLQRSEVSHIQDEGVEDLDVELQPFATCEVCDKRFYDPIPYHQHMTSKSHTKQLQKKQLMKNLKHLTLENAVEGSVQCSDCGKIFNGPKPLYEHLKGPAHDKKNKKEELIKMLLAKYPELLHDSLSNPNSLDSDNDFDSDDDMESVLICTICSKSFTGPENAREHFLSGKHEKAVKEKRRIEKLQRNRLRHDVSKRVTPATHEDSIVKNPSSNVEAEEDEFELIS